VIGIPDNDTRFIADDPTDHRPKFLIMGKPGHNVYRWDPLDAASVKEAKDVLGELMKKGYRAYEYSPLAQGPGKRIKTIDEFDPHNTSEIVLAAPVAGG
jgi:hypothetical protein